MKIGSALTALFFTILFTVSCGDEEKRPIVIPKQVSKDEIKDTNEPMTTPEREITEIDTLQPKEIKKIVITSNYNNLALFLGGYKQKGRNELTPYQDSATWKKYARVSDAKWSRLDRLKLKQMEKFRNTELAEINRNTGVLFYPFGGPDFLHAYEFFPYAKTFILIGLERLGSLPGVNNMTGDSAMIKYFAMVNRSLSAVLAISFFKTIDMKADFSSEELDGILPVFLIFCARTGCQVVDIKSITISPEGDVVHRAASDFSRAWAVEISLIDKYGDSKKLYYFTKNLNDAGFNPNSGFYKFVRKQGAFTTYLKAASYLMHNKDVFANIRNVILNQSDYVVQDDSGIPLSYFPESQWKLTFYGSYSKPIDLFKERMQPDLLAKYQDSSKIIPLNFGIGYQHTKGTSNMMAAKKIKRK